MVPIVSTIFCLLVLAVLLMEVRTSRPARIVLSPFWYFTFLVIIAFPVRAYLLDADLVAAQVLYKMLASTVYPSTYLVYAVVYAFVLWGVIYWGRSQTRENASLRAEVPMQQDAKPQFQISWGRPSVGLAGFALLSIVSVLAITSDLSTIFGGAAYQKARAGSGALWILPEMFVWASVGYIALWARRSNRPFMRVDYIVFGGILILAVWISGELHTRRLVAAIVLLYAVVAVLRSPRLWPLGAIGVIATLLAAPLLEFFRVLYNAGLADRSHSLLDYVRIILVDKALFATSGSFEGAGHMGRLIERASATQLMTGIDYGMSWLFNAGAAFIPRSLWDSKPLIYGGMEQFHWLYPQLFQNGFANSSVPMSFAVDFSFGFGLPVGLIVAFLFGRLLGVMERTFWDSGAHITQIALALFVYVYTFNWVRGGSIIIQSVALFAFTMVVLFGVRSTLHAVFGSIGETLGLVGGDWRGITRIFFFPHAYLRARQLDTVRHWAGLPAVNPEMAQGRSVSNVSRVEALTPSRPSWKSRVPLLNIKRRPKDAPENAALYVWGGLINKGPYITDIDNPYAYTGYNVFAVQMFRPVIKSFLESSRCLQIRCMSKACLDGVRAEYGDVAAQKAAVVYPYISAQVETPKAQTADRCRFLFVSTQFELKGGAALLKAFEAVVAKYPGAELDLVTFLPEEYKERVSELPNVRVFDANLSRDEVGKQFLSEADVLIHPTYMDSFGMVVLEALSYGLPVIATDVYAIREMVVDGQNGKLLQPPISGWDGVRPTQYFSDAQKIVETLPKLDTEMFEQSLADAMIVMCQDMDFRVRAGVASLELLRSRFEPS